jgi:hypothetical protein
MAAGRVSVGLALTALVVGFCTGCGAGDSPRSPSLSALPLVKGSTILTQAKRCDKGANAFCAIEFVLVDRSYRSSTQLLNGEHRLLISRRWSGADGDTGEQHAADSPGHKLRVTYATADGDLKGIDLGWIRRPRTITLTLSRMLFERVPTLSVMLEIGQG